MVSDADLYNFINIDAGCFENGVTAWGLIEKDHKGDVNFAATHSETLALRCCLDWMISSNHPGFVIIETDSESTVKCLQGKLNVAELDPVISDCIHFLFLLLNVIVAFISRTKNKAAHGFVEVAVNLSSRSWAGCTPGQIAAIVCKNSLSSN